MFTSRADRRVGAGDLGRRVARHRERLGLTREQVAERAGMAAPFLEYLETRPVAVELDTLIRLADTLGIPVWELLGGEPGLGPARSVRPGSSVTDELAAPECWARITPRGVGRLVLSTAEGPQALPVNYRVLDGTLLYRTSARSPLARVVGERVAFQVGRTDEVGGLGWSVLVTGRAEQVTDPQALEWMSRHADPRPWVGGQRDTWIRIKPRTITGRRISAADPAGH